MIDDDDDIADQAEALSEMWGVDAAARAEKKLIEKPEPKVVRAEIERIFEGNLDRFIDEGEGDFRWFIYGYRDDGQRTQLMNTKKMKVAQAKVAELRRNGILVTEYKPSR